MLYVVELSATPSRSAKFNPPFWYSTCSIPEYLYLPVDGSSSDMNGNKKMKAHVPVYVAGTLKLNRVLAAGEIQTMDLYGISTEECDFGAEEYVLCTNRLIWHTGRGRNDQVWGQIFAGEVGRTGRGSGSRLAETSEFDLSSTCYYILAVVFFGFS